MTLRFAANLSLLWADLPLGERFERAARAGFGAVELWWPGDEGAALLPGLTRRWGLHLALLNFDGGDLPAGDRGLAADPGAPRGCAPMSRGRCASPRNAAAGG
jgi:hydroxypyruvate isomerase